MEKTCENCETYKVFTKIYYGSLGRCVQKFDNYVVGSFRHPQSSCKFNPSRWKERGRHE